MPQRGAFTLLELLVVLAIIGLLAGLLLPALARAKAKGQGIACLNNIRQLMLAWTLYPEDNNGKLVRNAAFNGIARYRADTGGWIHGWLDYSWRELRQHEHFEIDRHVRWGNGLFWQVHHCTCGL